MATTLTQLTTDPRWKSADVASRQRYLHNWAIANAKEFSTPDKPVVDLSLEIFNKAKGMGILNTEHPAQQAVSQAQALPPSVDTSKPTEVREGPGYRFEAYIGDEKPQAPPFVPVVPIELTQPQSTDLTRQNAFVPPEKPNPKWVQGGIPDKPTGSIPETPQFKGKVGIIRLALNEGFARGVGFPGLRLAAKLGITKESPKEMQDAIERLGREYERQRELSARGHPITGIAAKFIEPLAEFIPVTAATGGIFNPVKGAGILKNMGKVGGLFGTTGAVREYGAGGGPGEIAKTAALETALGAGTELGIMGLLKGGKAVAPEVKGVLKDLVTPRAEAELLAEVSRTPINPLRVFGKASEYERDFITQERIKELNNLIGIHL